MKRIMVVAGETSGEAHAAGLVHELRNGFPEVEFEFFGAGGQAMADVGVDLLLDVTKMAAIGPMAALMHGKSYLQLFKRLLRQAEEKKPDLAILVDFPDFNLRLARRLKAKGIPVCYFIAPQVWAWRQGRVKQIRRYVDLMLVIFPFEEAFFRSHDVAAFYVGSPTAHVWREVKGASPFRETTSEEPPLVALLPGSRRKEVELILPVLLDAARYMSERLELRFSLVKAPAISRKALSEEYNNWVANGNTELPLEVVSSAREAFAGAACALVKSGTSTLEAMIAEVPFAMVYRLSTVSWLLLRPLTRAKRFCLANLVAGEDVAPEFVQWKATGRKIGEHLLRILNDPEEYAQVRAKLAEASGRLGEFNAYREGACRVAERFF